jgi:hypothetical protein
MFVEPAEQPALKHGRVHRTFAGIFSGHAGI